MNDLSYSVLETPFGRLKLAVDDGGTLVELWLPNRATEGVEPSSSSTKAAAGMHAAKTQLKEYFRGERRDFDLALAPRGTAFEQLVWDRLCAIPYGVTTSYGAIASELGLHNGARAVGRANGANPIAIVIPCHRVIGMDGRLTGYGGGLPLKQALLELEGARSPEPPRLI
jgi:methylated-DNA-[protein]-cysteine S-methyltransferase